MATWTRVAARLRRLRAKLRTLNEGHRLYKSCLCLASYFIIGLVMLILGPTVLDLRDQTGATDSEANQLFSTSAAGYVSGALVTGLTLHFFDVQMFLGIVTGLMSLVCAMIPWFSSLWPMLTAAFLMNAAGGGAESAVNFWSIRIWGAQSGPLLQFNSFAFGLGCLGAPLLAAPFLRSPKEIATSSAETESEAVTKSLPQRFVLKIPFIVIGLLGGLTFLAFLRSIIRDRAAKGKRISAKGHHNQEVATQVVPSVVTTPSPMAMTSRVRVALTVIPMSLFSLGYAGVCIVFPRYLTTFAEKGLGLPRETGAYMTSTYSMGFTFSRVVTIPLILRMTPSQSLAANSIIMTVGSVILILCGSPAALTEIFGLPATSDALRPGLWAGIAIISIGASTTFPCLFSFMERYLVVREWMSALMSTVFGLGEFIYPFILGATMETMPEMLLYLELISGLTCGFFLCLMVLAVLRKDDTPASIPLPRPPLPLSELPKIQQAELSCASSGSTPTDHSDQKTCIHI